ncbi:MAG: hypothetical protein O7F17_09505 [Planctomycetota bacterium]|nr:hypothetical protein [Planctomycetota bacterium]
MSTYGLGYRVAPPTRVCAATGRPLEPGSICMATLCERAEDDGFDRRDYSLQAWHAQARPEGLFSFWKAAVPHPDAGRRVFVDDDVLWDLFERLADDPRRRRMAYRFIIALILMRKKRLRYIGRTGEGENERWLMLPKGAATDQQPIEVINPRLGDEDVRELSEQLREVLRGEL